MSDEDFKAWFDRIERGLAILEARLDRLEALLEKVAVSMGISVAG